jgi:hypothetical protein
MNDGKIDGSRPAAEVARIARDRRDRFTWHKEDLAKPGDKTNPDEDSGEKPDDSTA